MKIIIFGAGGMLGHKMYQAVSQVFPQTYACFRRPLADFEKFNVFSAERTFTGIDVQNFPQCEKALNQLQPDIIINCIGITLRKKAINDLETNTQINALFPHRLKCWAATHQAKVIHFSTDCVFDGSLPDGGYTETCQPSADDAYGQMKYLGEITEPHCLTLRGSIVGRELHAHSELIEWALAQKGKSIRGFSQVIYSGVTTNTMADLVVRILQGPWIHGLYHVASAPISKLDLLGKLSEVFNLQLQIVDDPQPQSRKVLVAKKLQQQTGFACPSWDAMLSQLRKDPTAYHVG